LSLVYRPNESERCHSSVSCIPPRSNHVGPRVRVSISSTRSDSLWTLTDLLSSYGGGCGLTTVFVTETTSIQYTVTHAPAILSNSDEPSNTATATGPSYYSFAVISGTTSWINGASPTFTSYEIDTTIVTVYQTASASNAAMSLSMPTAPASLTGLGSGTSSGAIQLTQSSMNSVLPTVSSTSIAFSTVTLSYQGTTEEASSSPTESSSLASTRTTHVISTVTGPAVTIIESLSYVTNLPSDSTSTLTFHITSTAEVRETFTTMFESSSLLSLSSSTLSSAAVPASVQLSSYGASFTATSTAPTLSTTLSASSTGLSAYGYVSVVPLSNFSIAALTTSMSSRSQLSFYNSTIPTQSSSSIADAIGVSAQLTRPGRASSIAAYTSATGAVQVLPRYSPAAYGYGRPQLSSAGGVVSPANTPVSIASFSNATATSMTYVSPAALSSKSIGNVMTRNISMHSQSLATVIGGATSTSVSAYFQSSSMKAPVYSSVVNHTAVTTPSPYTSSRPANGFNMTATKTSSAATIAASASQCGVQGDILLTVSIHSPLVDVF